MKTQIKDLLEISKEVLLFSSRSLQLIKKVFNLEDEVSSRQISNLYLNYVAGNKEAKDKIMEHLKKDLIATENLYKKFLEFGII